MPTTHMIGFQRVIPSDSYAKYPHDMFFMEWSKAEYPYDDVFYGIILMPIASYPQGMFSGSDLNVKYPNEMGFFIEWF